MFEHDDEADGPDLGPDERDMDLLDGTWEQDYYAGRRRGPDWQTISVGVGLLVLMAMTIPMLVVFLG